MSSGGQGQNNPNYAPPPAPTSDVLNSDNWFHTLLVDPTAGVQNFIGQHLLGWDGPHWTQAQSWRDAQPVTSWTYDRYNQAAAFTSHVVSASALEWDRLFGGDPRAQNPFLAWGDSRGVSPGQAILSNPLLQSQGTQALVGNFGRSPWGNVKLNPYGAVEVDDAATRKAAFESGGLGQLASGTADFAVSYYTDPAVLAGYGAKPLIAAARGTQVATGARIAKERSVIASGKAKVDMAQAEGIGVENAGLTAREAGYKEIFDAAEQGNRAYLLERLTGKHNGIYQPEALVNALVHANSYDERATVYLAARGDVVAQAALSDRYAAVADQLYNANRDVDNIKTALQGIPKKVVDPVSGEKVLNNEWLLGKAQYRTNKAIANDVAPRSAWLHGVTGGSTDQAQGIFNALRGNQLVSPIRALNEQRSVLAYQQARHWSDQVIDPLGAGGRTLHYLGYAGNAAPGYIATAGIASEGSWTKVRDTLKNIDMPNEMVDRYVNRWTDAVTANARQEVLAQMEHEVMSRITLARLGPEATAQQVSEAESFVNAMMKKLNADRGDAINEYRQSGNWMHDVDSGRSTKLAPLEDMQAQNVPLTDFKLYKQLLDEYDRDAFTTMLKQGKNVALHGAAAFSQMWKASVLLRVGAVPRNLGESWLASWVFLSRFPSNFATGIGRGVGNTYERLIARRAWDRANPELGGVNQAMSAKQVQELLEDRLSLHLVHRQAKVDNLADLVKQSRQDPAAYYDTAHQHGFAVSHDEVMRAVLDDAPAGRRNLLNKGERAQYAGYAATLSQRALKRGERANFGALHAKATRAYLSQRVAGQHFAVEGIGRVKPSQIPDSAILRGDLGTTPRVLGDSGVYQVRPYSDVLKSAKAQGVTPEVEANLAARAEFPTWQTVYGDVRESTDDIAASIARDDQAIEETRKALADLAESMKPAQAKSRGYQQLGYGGYTGAAPRGGVPGKIVEDFLGAQRTNQTLLSAYDTRRFAAAQYSRRMSVMNGSHKQYDPTDPLYWQASAEFANRMVRNSEFAKRLLISDDPEGTAQWLLKTPQGRKILKTINLDHATEDAVTEWTYRAHYNLFRAYPNASLRKDILEHEVTPEQVHAYLADRTDLVPTIAREYVPTLRSTTLGQAISSGIDSAFKYLWTLPENKLARYPLYDQLYRDEWYRIVREAQPHLETMTQGQAQAWITKNADTAARSYAAHTTQRVVYSSEVRSNVAEKLRFIAPFAQVTGNRFYYYGTQALENPQNIARLFIGWNAISTDANGNVNIHLPGWLRSHIPGMDEFDKLPVNKQSFNLIANGEPWWSPGFGPVVTVPAAKLLRDHADSPIGQYMTKLGGQIGLFPGGYLGQGPADQLLPSWGRRILAGQGQQYANSFALIKTIETWKYENHLRDKPPSDKEISERNNHLWAFRVLSSFVSPVQFQVQNDMVEHYTQIHRDYVKKYGKDADVHFLADYPESFDLVLDYTQNPTGIAPTQQASALESQHADLIASLPDPSMGAMLTNLPGSNGQFDQSAYYWQMDRPVAPGSPTNIREGKDANQAVDDRITQRGWIEYRQATAWRDSMLLAAKQAGGSNNLQAKDNLWIKILFDRQRDQILKDTRVVRPDGSTYSPWGEDFAQQDDATYGKRADGLRMMLADPKVINDPKTYPWAQSGAQYLTLRDHIRTLLAAQPSQDINAADNSWLRLLWERGAQQISDADPVWAQWRDRYFSKDDLSLIPGGE